MKVVQINVVCGKGSTGTICVGISNVLTESEIENYILYCVGESNLPQAIKCAGNLQKLEAVKSRILGNYGFNSETATEKIIRELNRIKPDVVHLHNLHGHNCNLKMLMDYFRENDTKLIWTFHDCWNFTAYCPHYSMERCEQWLTGCSKCPQIKKFCWFVDRSKWLYQKKKEAFSNIDMTIVTPSKWLADQVKKSFLKDYPIRTIYNGIDLSVFRPCDSDIRGKYGIPQSKRIILGVAIQWVARKAPDVFIELSRRLDNNRYQIVMVGTDDEIDKLLPNDIISIHRTQNQKELAEIYSAADLFVNPTREEVLGLVNIEALACGTPVVTFNTGGSPECIDATCGSVVPCDDIEALEREIIDICETGRYTRDNCVRFAQNFDQNLRFKEYVKLYDEIVEK